MKGLYIPELEHDSCGIGCIANIDGHASSDIIQDALTMLENMEHRGGTGSDPDSGDGAGILMQVPHTYLSNKTLELGFQIPEFGSYGVGMIFFPRVKSVRDACKDMMSEIAKEMGLTVIGYRTVPVNHTIPGSESRRVEPIIEQVFLKHDTATFEELERRLFLFRNYATHKVNSEVIGSNGEYYLPSLSHKVIIYKGQLRTDQLRSYYLDLQSEELTSALAVVHSRFSTNTFPNWKLAQPFRYIAHNGEINTIKGNVTKMKSKEAIMKSEFYSDEELQKLLPITNPQNSDSANLDALVEMLTINGRSLPHVMMMLVPEAWQDNKLMNRKRKAFYKYHASLMEPWDGPAALIFSDGNMVGATLDRNGLRPSRYCITKDGRLIISSEAGALPVDFSNVEKNGRIQPGKMLIADLKKGIVRYDNEIKKEITNQQPYDDWINTHRVKLRLIKVQNSNNSKIDPKKLNTLQQAYGYTSEDLKLILKPMAEKATEPIGSMGADTPLAVLSNQSQHISNYFKQLFAQVSNPPIDPIRERMVMSLFTRVGKSLNLLAETPEHTKQVHISQPVLLNSDIEKFKQFGKMGLDYAVLNSTFNADGLTGRLEQGLDELCTMATKAVKEGKSILIISDKAVNEDRAPIPSLIAIGAVHHHLVANNLRTEVGLIVEAGDVWETHHFATIIGYG
ncbi:MAG: glutamate synthase central domain-containing protein, partial [Fulvivirga sp.]|uniref:glutamate synthase central domain-containing protein n=1 Tax=Fulvivirga sp. TaxID=1931237 RepID=UPI0032EC9B98